MPTAIKSSTLVLTLPWPPSVNEWKTPIVRKTRTGYHTSAILTSAAREFRSSAKLAIMLQRGAVMFQGPVAVSIRLIRGDGHSFDCDNPIKATIDAMTHAGVWRNDSQVYALQVTKVYAKGEQNCAQVTVTEIEAAR